MPIVLIDFKTPFMKKPFLFSFLLFFFTNNILAQTYVDGAGACGGNTPCYTTIQAGVTAATAGSTVNVYPGTYTELVTINKPLTLQSTGGKAVTTINYTTPGYYIAPIMIVADNGSHSGGVTIGGNANKGFTIVGADVTNDVAGGGFESAAIIIGSNSTNTITNINISHNTITANGDLALLTYYKPDDTYTNLNVNNNTFNGQTYVGTPISGGYFSHGNVPRFAIGVNPGTTNFIFDGNVITTNSGAVVAGTNIGRGSVYAEPKGSTITNNIFRPTFANGVASRAILLLGGTSALVACNYFSMANANSAPFYVKAANNPASYAVNTVASSNTFVSPGGVIVGDSIGVNTQFSGTAANSTNPASGCSVLALQSMVVGVQKINSNTCTIYWNTTGENQCKNFDVLLSNDGVSFFTIATLPSKGNGNNKYQFNYTNTSGQNVQFVKIRQSNTYNNNFTYSPTQSIYWNMTSTIFCSPNPMQNSFKVYNLPNNEQCNLYLYNSNGSLVHTASINNFSNKVLTSLLPQGVYFYKVYNSLYKTIATGKLIKQ
jgi:hypothetical protein